MSVIQKSAFVIDHTQRVECGQCRRFCPLPGAIVINADYQHEIVNDPCSRCGLCVAFYPLPGAIVPVSGLLSAIGGTKAT